ncbi:MAG: SGNH/GDSL hydrolase family protein [Halomonadaceae bacterium]|nr:MAG: SGNH/GDSL hydrolase family protein [Halomonadaceae bacterium]
MYKNKLFSESIAQPTKQAFRVLAAIGLSVALTGCGQLGQLLSNPQVSDADNNQVIFVGDSIFALSGGIQDILEEKAGETFRRYTVSGAQLNGGFLAPSIPEQYATAYADNPNITTMVGDAGGNDILIPAIFIDPNNCKTRNSRADLSDRCKAFIDDLYVDGVDFLNSIADDGVQNGVLLGYYYTKNGLFWLASMKQAVDYGNMILQRACDNSTLDCAFVDPRSTIENSDILFDGIHPNASGSAKLAELIWPKLQPLL